MTTKVGTSPLSIDVEVVAELAAQAVHVLDRFHVVARLNKTIDEVRAGEAREPHLRMKINNCVGAGTEL